MAQNTPELMGEEPRSKPQLIMAAALELFSEKGFSATRLDEVARRAGVAKGTLYLYFDSKQDLFIKVVEHALRQNIAPLEQAFKAHKGSVAGFLETVFQTLGQRLGEGNLGVMPKMILAEAAHFPELAAYYRDHVIKRVHRFFTAVIERGIAEGEFREVEAKSAARVLMAPFLMLALVRQTPVIREGFRIDPKAHVAAARDLLFNGLLRAGGHRP